MPKVFNPSPSIHSGYPCSIAGCGTFSMNSVEAQLDAVFAMTGAVKKTTLRQSSVGMTETLVPWVTSKIATGRLSRILFSHKVPVANVAGPQPLVSLADWLLTHHFNFFPKF